jgi:hypothetical protein
MRERVKRPNALAAPARVKKTFPKTPFFAFRKRSFSKFKFCWNAQRCAATLPGS